MHVTGEPPILYFGTPVVLISTINDDGSFNLAPMSSAFWLGWRCVLGLSALSRTTLNMQRERQCVLNLASVDNVEAVNRLAKTTGAHPVPAVKQRRGYRYVREKFATAGLTAVPAQTVRPPRALQCPVQLEAVVESQRELAENDPQLRGRTIIFEVRIQRVHLDPSILVDGHPDRVDPDKWRPLIMSFQQFYGLQAHKLHVSTLAEIPESMYRTPDVDRAAA